jgi:hypothetical protein
VVDKPAKIFGIRAHTILQIIGDVIGQLIHEPLHVERR